MKDFELMDYIKAIVESYNPSELNRIIYESIFSEKISTDDFRIISEIYLYKVSYLDVKGGANSDVNA